MKRSIYFFITLAICSTQLFAMEGNHDPLATILNDEEGAPGTHEYTSITIRRRESRSAEKVDIPTKYLESGFWNNLSKDARLDCVELLRDGSWDDLDLESNDFFITMLQDGRWSLLDIVRRNLFIARWNREVSSRKVKRDGTFFQDYRKMLDEVLLLITPAAVDTFSCCDAISSWDNIKATSGKIFNKSAQALRWFEQRVFACMGAPQACLEDVAAGRVKINEMDLDDYEKLVFIKNYLAPIIESACEGTLELQEKLVWELSEFIVLVEHEIAEHESDDESRGLNEIMMKHIINSFDDVIIPIIDELLQDLEPRNAKKAKTLMFVGAATVLCGVQYGSHYCLGTPILVDPVEFISLWIASRFYQE